MPGNAQPEEEWEIGSSSGIVFSPSHSSIDRESSSPFPEPTSSASAQSSSVGRSSSKAGSDSSSSSVGSLPPFPGSGSSSGHPDLSSSSGGSQSPVPSSVSSASWNRLSSSSQHSGSGSLSVGSSSSKAGSASSSSSEGSLPPFPGSSSSSGYPDLSSSSSGSQSPVSSSVSSASWNRLSSSSQHSGSGSGSMSSSSSGSEGGSSLSSGTSQESSQGSNSSQNGYSSSSGPLKSSSSGGAGTSSSSTYASSQGSQTESSSSSAENACPKPTGDAETWHSLMNTSLWQRLRAGNAPFNWCVQPDGSWLVFPTACSLAGENCSTASWSTVINPPTTPNRNLNDIFTAFCRFSDFNLKFDYRCPNMRDTWKDCSSALKGPRNWGNSGVKIFHTGSTTGAEVVISDFDWPDTGGAFVNNANITTLIPAPVQATCGSNSSNALPYGQICGAIYGKITPQAKPIIFPGSSANNDPRPNGTWNSMEIGFMAARYDSAGILQKKATITVKINGNPVMTHVGIPNFQPTTNKVPDKYLAGPNKGQWVYGATGTGWTRDSGYLLLQEHDNMVQFRDIRINLDWLPRTSGVFDDWWQRNP